jgi:hypothetical protein
VVDEDAVLRREPFVSLSGASPGLEESAVRVELKDGGRRDAALRLRRIECRGLLAVRDRIGPVEHPEVIVRIDGDAADLSADPLVRQGLRPQRIGLEERHLLPVRLRGCPRQECHRDAGCHGGHNTDGA